MHSSNSILLKDHDTEIQVLKNDEGASAVASSGDGSQKVEQEEQEEQANVTTIEGAQCCV